MKSFSRLFNLYRIRFAYYISLASICVSFMITYILLAVFLGEDLYRVTLYFIPLAVIAIGSFLTISIMEITGFIIVGSSICESKEEKKKIKEYAFLGLTIPRLFFLIYLSMTFVLLTIKDPIPAPIFLVVFSGVASIYIIYNLISRKLDKKVTKVYKKGFIYQDYAIPFEFISRIDYMHNFNLTNYSKQVFLKIYVNDKKSIKIAVKLKYSELKEAYSNIRFFSIRENRYLEETNPNK